MGNFLKWWVRPIETRVEESVNHSTEYYKSMEEQVMKQITELIKKENTSIDWNSRRDKVIIKNKEITIFVNQHKQRVLWSSQTMMDSMPVTLGYIGDIFKLLKKREDIIYDNLEQRVFDVRGVVLKKIEGELNSEVVDEKLINL